MFNRGLAGAGALLAGPLVVIAAVIALPTLSDKAATQVAAVDHHRNAMLAGMTLQTIAIALFIGGTVWLAMTLSRHAPRLAYVGGVLAVLGALIVLFVDSMHAGAIAAALGVDPAHATATVDRVLSSRTLTIFEPLQVLQDLGLVVLAVAAAKAGVPRWAAAAIAVGAVAEGAGFGAGSRPLVGAAFAVMLVGLIPAVTVLTGARRTRPHSSVQPAAA
jgi:hypothetical protein